MSDEPRDPLRHHRESDHAVFGGDRFGQAAEHFARLFGTPAFIIGQTIIVAIWIFLNVVAVVGHWDPYPFILLNLAFSTQAAYAAPLILLAATRQADRDKRHAEADARHREELAQEQAQQLALNTELTAAVHALTAEIHAAIAPTSDTDTPAV
jgi:uncharacterized membrane protein